MGDETWERALLDCVALLFFFLSDIVVTYSLKLAFALDVFVSDHHWSVGGRQETQHTLMAYGSAPVQHAVRTSHRGQKRYDGK